MSTMIGRIWPAMSFASISVVSVVASAAHAQAPVMPVTGSVRFSISDMIATAEPIVKAVMLILVALSIATWAVLFAKERALRLRRGTLQTDITALSKVRRFADAPRLESDVLRRMHGAVEEELAHGQPALAARLGAGIETRIGLKLRTIEDAESRDLSHGLGVLANVGANAPFIGLLGTVWGIMHAFIGIAETKSTSLAVVAPGIAEALFTTALGLAAAIPATIMYNSLGRRMVGYRGRMEAAIAAFQCLVSLECEQAKLAATPQAGA